MSEEQPKEPINFGDQVVLQKPKKPDDPGRSYSEPGLIVLILITAFLYLVLSPDQSPSPPTTTAPTQTRSPTATPEPIEGAATASTPTSNPSSHGCQEGIAVDRSVNVVYKAVRVRKSAGYVRKNDAQDSVHYLRPGDKVTVTSGPTQIDGLCWWEIEHEGVEGWSADHSNEGRVLLQAGQ